MQDKLNEDLFEAALKRVFCDYTDEQLASYPDCEALAKKYPLPKKEKRAFDRAAKQMKYNKSLVKVYLSRAAVVFLCIIALGACVMMTSPTVRAAVKNVIVEWFDKYTNFSFVATDTGSGDFENVEDVKIGYIPEGYELVNISESPFSITYFYCFADKEYYIDVFKNNENELFADNERSKYENVVINNHQSWVIYDNVNNHGSLILTGSKISISISGDLPKDELIKIAESIKCKL